MDFHFQSWWSNRDQSYLSTLKQLHNWTKCVKQRFSDTGWQAVQESDSCEKGNKWGESYDCFSILPGEFPGHRIGKGEELCGLTEDRICGTKYQRGSFTGNTGVLQGMLSGLYLSPNLHMRVREWPRAWERTSRKKASNPWSSPRTGNSFVFLLASMERPPNTAGIISRPHVLPPQ